MKKASLIIAYGSDKYLSFIFNDGSCYKVNMKSKLSMFLFRVKSGFSANHLINDMSIKILTLGRDVKEGLEKQSEVDRCKCDAHAEPNFDIEPPRPKWVTGA